MVKLVCLIRRPEGQRHDEFVHWWLGHHAGVASRLPGLRRYVISVVEPGLEAQPDYDGVAELWFDDLDAYRAAFASPEGERTSAEDRELIGGRIALLTREHVVVGEPDGTVPA